MDKLGGFVVEKMFTYVNDPVLRVVCIRAANVKSLAVSHRLNDSDVISTIEVLQQDIH